MNQRQEDTLLIDLHYFPCVEYFTHIQRFDKLLLEVNEHYVKQSYRNRCYVQIANKIQLLTVPVIKGGSKTKTKVRDIRISYEQRWQDHHWRTIASAYGKAPFFAFFAEEFYDILYKKYEFLIDLNLDLLTKCLGLLGMGNKEVLISRKYVDKPDNRVADYRGTIHPKKKNSARGFFNPLPYNQVFGKDFVQNLSVIDLLFCEGSRAGSVISESISYER